MRATTHNGRAGKDGVYNTRHNDRNFDTSHAEHIDPERAGGNIYWNWTGNPAISFEDAEKAFYNSKCRGHLREQNKRYEQQRHPERVRSMDEYRGARQTCPEEMILMVGDKDSHTDPATLWEICKEFKNWQEQTFPGLKVLDMALHTDEQGAPHVHARQVWLYRDKQGLQAVGQDKCLQAAGIPLPHPEQPRTRYNNRKQTASKMMREQFFQICRAYGLELETQPRERSQSGLTQIEYKARQEEKKLNKIKGAKVYAQERTQKAQEQAQKQEDKNRSLQATESRIRSKMEQEQRTARQLAEMNQKARQTLREMQKQLEVLKPYLSKAEQKQLEEQQKQLEREWDEPERD